MMSESHSLGQKGEEIAAGYLKNKGFRIRHQNWVAGKKELDIVAENSDNLVFVEVKTLTYDMNLQPRDLVTREKQKLMILAAEAYIRKYDINKESRFDVITVISKGKEFEIDHIENAFYPTLR
jgi:putative endonuclease